MWAISFAPEREKHIRSADSIIVVGQWCKMRVKLFVNNQSIAGSWRARNVHNEHQQTFGRNENKNVNISR
jgi:hypothetical protein